MNILLLIIKQQTGHHKTMLGARSELYQETAWIHVSQGN